LLPGITGKAMIELSSAASGRPFADKDRHGEISPRGIAKEQSKIESRHHTLRPYHPSGIWAALLAVLRNVEIRNVDAN
jgi:hypothetical protein